MHPQCFVQLPVAGAGRVSAELEDRIEPGHVPLSVRCRSGIIERGVVRSGSNSPSPLPVLSFMYR